MHKDIFTLPSSISKQLVDSTSHLGLTLKSGITADDREIIIGELVKLARKTNGEHLTTLVWICDAMASQPKPKRGQLASIAEAAGVSAGTLRNVKMVCSRIIPSRRRDELSWSHHMEVGLATDNDQLITDWLDQAVQDDLSVRDLRKRIRTSLKLKTSPKPAPDRTVASFKVLRELNATVRSIKLHRSTWENWSRAEWEEAGKGLGPLLEFTSCLQRSLPAYKRLAS